MADELRKSFRSIGKRFTSQRGKIWAVFRAKPSGLSVVQAADLLRAEGIGQTTVYRVVKELVELGFLKWVHGAEGEHQYVAATGGHCHPLVCRHCGRVELIDCQGLSTLQKLVSIETGFRVEGHHLEIYGVCPQCLTTTSV